VYESSHLDRTELRNKTVACLLQDDAPDVQGIAPELVAAFSGKPSLGQSFFRRILDDALAGHTEFVTARWEGRDVRSVPELEGQAAWETVSLEKDEYGVVQLHVSDGSRLRDLCDTNGWDYLIIIEDLSLSFRAWEGSDPVPVQGHGRTLVAAAQVFLISGDTSELLYHAYVTGSLPFNRDIKRAGHIVIERFASDLMKALS